MPGASSLSSFLGAKDFATSREFYRTLDFGELVIDSKLSYFRVDKQFGFYLQNYYVKDWVDNCMMFLEVDDISEWHQHLTGLGLPKHYPGTRVSEITDVDWGQVIYLNDPSGILWHIGRFT